MTRDEVVQIAWDVGLFMRSHKFQDEPTKLERFAERVAAHEREECAKVCDDTAEDYWELSWADQEAAAAQCAAAIRARGAP